MQIILSCLALLTLCYACQGQNAAGFTDSASAMKPAGLGSPRTAAMLAAPPVPSASAYGRLLFGANGPEQFGGQHVTKQQHLAIFSPEVTPGVAVASDVAYALYCFNLADYDGNAHFTVSWIADPPAAADVYYGFGNYEADRWDWHQPTDLLSPVDLGELNLYTSEQDRLVMAVVLVGVGDYVLESITVGERWIELDIDFTEIYAPPLEFEIAEQWQSWAERDPVEHNYHYIGDVVDEFDVRRAVLSHQVDGWNHYGTMRYPISTGLEKYPLIIFCHPGSGGGSTLRAEMDFIQLIQDTDFSDQFFVVMPSFRSEGCYGESLGSFHCNGPASINDRDADDTIALLDCILNHIPGVDPDNIFIYGYSRGAQVAIRAAQRDDRFKGVASYCGYTDEWSPDLQLWTASAVSMIGPEEPTYHFSHIAWDLVYGSKDVWQARSSLLLTTTAYFCETLPATQLHYGVLDQAVSINQGRRMDEVLAEMGKSNYEYYEYNAGHGEFHGMGGGVRLKQFLSDLINVEN